jgi:uncharacterized protein YecT (DUF1311 family)
MRNVTIFAILLLACCQQQQQGTPESWENHCAALAQIRADRQMNNAYLQGVGANNAEAMKRKIKEECLMKLQQEKPLPSHNSRF